MQQQLRLVEFLLRERRMVSASRDTTPSEPRSNQQDEGGAAPPPKEHAVLPAGSSVLARNNHHAYTPAKNWLMNMAALIPAMENLGSQP
jgi:hypothetical protein